MHDPFLKSFYADRRMVEILIRDHVPEWAGEIDFSTLREEPTALVSRKTLQQRHPDMIWSAGVAGGGWVLFLVEFQRKAERLMALRTTTYAALTLERIAAGTDLRRGRPLPEFVHLVLYHGDGPWSGPEHVTELFERSDPGRFRLVSWRGGEGADRPPDDITGLVLGLARNLSPEDMAAGVAALGRTVAERGDAGLEALVFERVGTMQAARGQNPPGIRPAMHPRWRFAQPSHTVNSALRNVMSTIHSAPSWLRSALLLGRIALLFPLRRALPARRLAGLGARAALSTDRYN